MDVRVLVFCTNSYKCAHRRQNRRCTWVHPTQSGARGPPEGSREAAGARAHRRRRRTRTKRTRRRRGWRSSARVQRRRRPRGRVWAAARGTNAQTRRAPRSPRPPSRTRSPPRRAPCARRLRAHEDDRTTTVWREQAGDWIDPLVNQLQSDPLFVSYYLALPPHNSVSHLWMESGIVNEDVSWF